VDKSRLRIAIQKSGRLADDSMDLLKSAGLKIQKNKSGLFYRIKDLPIDLLLVRDDDIPGFVSEGIADLGIVGSNVFKEFSLQNESDDTSILMRLGFSRCKLSIATPNEAKYEGTKTLEGAKIATSYPEILGKYLKDLGVTSTIVEMHGAVEVAPTLGIADAICDIVSSGATLEANGLTQQETIFKSEAFLLKTPQEISPEKLKTISRITTRFEGVQASRETKYIMLNAPREALEKVTELLPGAEAPTVIPLEGQDGMVAVHSVCRESVFWETMEKLRNVGATSILVLPIEKMMA